jgi:hypothetical protein
MDFVLDNGDFNADNAVVRLGVGKNMVAAIRFWLRAFGLTNDSDSPTLLGRKIFEPDSGIDPFLESPTTIWLLHYQLVTTGYASIFSYFFNQFQVTQPQFTAENLLVKLKDHTAAQGQTVADKTLEKDISILVRTYYAPKPGSRSDIEDMFSGVLVELGLLHDRRSMDAGERQGEWLRVRRDIRSDLPHEVVLHAILKMIPEEGTSISFKDMFTHPNSPGLVFCLTRDGLLDQIERIQAALPDQVVFSQTAGNDVLQLKVERKALDVLYGYFND